MDEKGKHCEGYYQLEITKCHELQHLLRPVTFSPVKQCTFEILRVDLK